MSKQPKQPTTLTTSESTFLDSINVRVRKTNAVFINSSGYKTIKTHRNNISCLSDKIICVHTLIAQTKYGGCIEECIYQYKTFKLESHHKDGNKLNNNPKNIIGFLTRQEHKKLEYELNKNI